MAHGIHPALAMVSELQNHISNGETAGRLFRSIQYDSSGASFITMASAYALLRHPYHGAKYENFFVREKVSQMKRQTY